MSHRIEVFCSIDPEDGREFVAVITWFRDAPSKPPFAVSHANFYASSARDAKAAAEGWLERERKRLQDVEDSTTRRIAERSKKREASCFQPASEAAPQPSETLT